ncbi:VanZ family protein [Lutibacter sp. B2]|nr:VanZ family protein [Lutibacter sp. B2]
MNKKRIIILISWTVVFLWMALIFNLSSQVADESNKLSKGVTKIIVKTVAKVAPETDFDISKFNHIVRKNAHFFAYLILGVLVMYAMRRSDRKGIRRVVLTLLICVLYAISDEVHQLFVPGRGPGVKDVFIDSAGASVGICMYRMISRIKNKVMTSR